MVFSVIIPVYNRPDEINELLASLTAQTVKDFEVLVIEDGSDDPCKHIVDKYKNKLAIQYYFKKNSGQGFSRNFGFQKAQGDYFVVFDSDCIIPPHYFETVKRFLFLNRVDCWGGPDRSHSSFTPVQKAINHSMTSFYTTGGIRGGQKKISRFHPRSFNMGISREVYEKTGGYRITRMGEDIEFSIRILQKGFRSALITDAWVYHKRRTSLKQFFWQLHFFGRARINIQSFYPDEIRPVHFFPVIFLIGFIISIILWVTQAPFFSGLIFLYPAYAGVLFMDALFREKDVTVANLAVVTGFAQLSAYALGMLSELWNRIKIKERKR